MALSMSERQLNLFRGRKQRGRVSEIPTPSEFQLQACLVDLIRRTISPQWKFGHVPNGELRDKITACRLKRLGTMPGWPDLQFAGPDRRMAFLELKRRGGRLSDAQLTMRDHLEGCGFPYLVTDSVDQAIAWLKHHGILRGGFTVQ
jgi:hypothetical protein